MKWKCNKENHKSFEMIFHNAIKLKRWCPECQKESYHIKDSEKILADYVKSRNGTIISIDSSIINSNTYITFKCNEKEHKHWKATYRNVTKFQTWCPECAGRFTPKEYIEKAKEYAISRGGVYVSGEYKNQNSKLTFKCGKANHKPWSVRFNNIVPLKTWCKVCVHDNKQPFRDEQLKKAHEHAKSKGGKCLSTNYINSHQKLLWQCEKEHKPWEAKYSNVVGKLQRWCPECAGYLAPEEFLEKAKQHALSRGGECLSKEYLSSSEKLVWSCSVDSHKSWKASYPNVVIQNTWCPECKNSINIRENYTRVILEELLGFSLESSFPEWNINPKEDYN